MGRRVLVLLGVLLAVAAVAPRSAAALEVRLTDAGLVFGDGVLREAPGARLGFRDASGPTRRATGVRSQGPGEAVLATDDPLGRTIALRYRTAGDGIAEVRATVPGARALSIGFMRPPGERFLGFGERSDQAVRTSGEVETFVADGPYQPEERGPIAAFVPPQGYSARDDATYYPVPWALSTRGYGLLLDNAENSRFRLDGDAWTAEADSAELRFRVFAGPTPAAALARFTEATGRQPRVAEPWVFGAWWQPDRDELGELDAQRRAGVPVSVTETFLHYLPCADHLPDRERVRRRTAALRARGTAALAYVNPMVCTSHPRYGEGTYTTDATGQPYRYRYSTADQFLVSQVDFTSPAGRSFFGSLIRETLEDGFDGFMEDFGEYTPPDGRSADGTPGPVMHNLYPTLYHEATTAESGRYVANYVRSGFTGTARHARIVWGGDPTTDWGYDGLESAVRQALSIGASGVSTWGSDIGGFFSLGSRRLTPELYRRWIQFGAVSGVMRAKSEGIAIPARARPQVTDPDVLPLWRRYARLRTQLLPYLEAADAEYQRTGMPLMRAFALTWPGDERLAGVEDAFGFGPDLLAAPVLRPGARERRVALPPGTWVDLWRSADQDGEHGALRLRGAPRLLEGGRDVTLPAPEDELLLLARAGTVLALLPADVDTLAPYDSASLTSLRERRSTLRLLVLPRGRSEARPHGTERVVSSERSGRRWVLRIDGTRRRRYEVEASLGALRRPFRACAVRSGRRNVPFRLRDGVLRFDVRGRRLRVEVRGCRRQGRRQRR